MKKALKDLLNELYEQLYEPNAAGHTHELKREFIQALVSGVSQEDAKEFVEALVKIVCEHSHYKMLAVIAEALLDDLKTIVQEFEEVVSEEVEFI